jgi:hypothetical protein
VGGLVEFGGQHRHPFVPQRQQQTLFAAEQPPHLGSVVGQCGSGPGVGGRAIDDVGHEGHALVQC